jgi:hypothetical protein
MADAIRIAGLKEFVRDLKKLDAELPKVLRVAFNAAGEDIVKDAQAKIPARSGRARGSIKMKSTQKEARIVGGSAKVPYYAWLDFGGKLPRGGKRPFIREGRYIYAAYFRQRAGVAVKLEAALLDAARAAGVEVE